MEDIAAFEGLVGKTAFLFHAQLGMEQEDLRQELWIKVTKAKRAYDPARSRMTEQAFVYSCLANFVKDCKKIAARRSVLRVSHIEDYREQEDQFEFRYQHVSEEAAFAMLDQFAWPSCVTIEERKVAVLLIVGYDHGEVAELMGLQRTEVAATLRQLREKLADWRPSRDEEADVIPFPAAPAPSPLIAIPA